MNKSDILSGFNNHLMELINDVIEVLPENNDIKAVHTTFSTIKKVNPRLIISIWKKHILDKYEKEIMSGDLNFFLDKEYDEDVELPNSDLILSKISDMKKTIVSLSDDNKVKKINYFQNLTKLCKLYHNYE